MYILNNRNFLTDGSIVNDDIQAGGSFLTRQLLQTLPTVYQKEYAAYWAFEGNMSIPVAGNLAGYTDRVEEIRYEAKGTVQEYVDNTTDIPTLKSAFASDSFNVHTFSLATNYSLHELAAMEVQPQKMAKDLQFVNETLRRAVHKLLVFGSVERNSAGLFNDANVPTDSGLDLSTLTWQQLVDFFSDRICEIEDNNELTVRIAKIYVSNKLYSFLSRTRQAGDSSKSVMQAIREDYPGLMFERVNECKASLLEANGVRPAGTDEERIIFAPQFNNNEVDRLADAPDSMPSQWVDMTYRTVFFLRSSQTIIHKPKSMLYYDIPSLV